MFAEPLSYPTFSFQLNLGELSRRLHKIICVDKASGKGLLKAPEILASSCIEVTHTWLSAMPRVDTVF